MGSLSMILALLATLSAAQQSQTGIPPAPPPPPVATTPRIRAAIDTAKTCFDKQWEISRERRFAAERLVKPLTAPVGSPEWRTARTAVLALVTARRELSECLKQMARAARATTEADRSALDYWASFMAMNIDGQAPYET